MEIFFLFLWLIWVVPMILAFGLMIFWIIKIVEVAQINEAQFRAAGSEKTNWILIIVLTNFIGALIWQFSMRDRVLAAPGATTTPPGWYADPNGEQRWWDGTRWTEHTAPEAQQPSLPSE